jgi:hypothetical protein
MRPFVCLIYSSALLSLLLTISGIVYAYEISHSVSVNDDLINSLYSISENLMKWISYTMLLIAILLCYMFSSE